MRTILDWYKYGLPKLIGDKAIKNVIDQGRYHMLEKPTTSLKNAMITGFNWNKSNEGIFYWNQVIKTDYNLIIETYTNKTINVLDNLFNKLEEKYSENPE